MAIEPTPQVPKKQLVNKRSVPVVSSRFQKVGTSIGYDETFPEDIWEDENNWNNENVWGS